ncbi:hypothetical protein B0I35DRAFT_445530 [Stachybotrys elegans]|uniref:Zn(2)-C6 fungal-type domain-containing protein n=1 Tax=Stachybotrys elegans TaxID=80388 RepID=A0A8K0WK95_9HYPO|nr:hypothetical protein B0I35DRAFT_445530 [Stachybotrys elegans]
MERLRATSRSAKWGEACAPCAATKTRCIRRNIPGAKCDKCESLGRECGKQVPAPRKKRRAKPPKSADTDERLNHLTDTLQVSDTACSITRQKETPPASSHATAEPRAPETPACTCRAPVSRTDVASVESDEILLSIYMNQLSPQFPFVIISPGTSPKQLQKTRPFLFKVIRMVSSVRNLASMWAQSHTLMKHISNVMLLGSERSLDLLQGILVFLGYYHYFCMSHAHFNNLVHLAASLVGDMDLSTCPTSYEAHHRPALARDGEQRQRTNEERRAILGSWYISSNAAMVVNQLGPARYTRYLDQCLNELEIAAEYETDQLAVELIRVQHVIEKIFQFHTRDQLVDELPGIPKASATIYLEAFQTELDTLCSALPTSLGCNYLLLCHYNSARLRLFAPFIGEMQLSHLDTSPLDIFSQFTTAINTWFRDWHTVPVCLYFYLSQPVAMQIIYASRSLVQWARLAGPNAVTLSSMGNTTNYGDHIPYQKMPAFMGVPPCPDLVVPQTASASGSVSGQITLNMLRAQITARPELRVDLLGIAAATATRFEAARTEMAAAQGVVWRNETWDAAAAHMRSKRARVAEWCEIAMAAKSDDGEMEPLSLFHGDEDTSMLPRWGFDSLNQDWHWEGDGFGGTDLDDGVIHDAFGGWITNGMGDLG